MSKKCDHTSVGMLVWKGKNLLLIERKKFPFGFAPPAGHVDGDISFEEAAKRELKEEVGLTAQRVKLIAEGRKENCCRRENGSWHYWKIYEVEAGGRVIASKNETKKARFFSSDDLLLFVAKTEKYLAGKIREEDWQKSPGIEPVWYEWFKELNLI